MSGSDEFILSKDVSSVASMADVLFPEKAETQKVLELTLLIILILVSASVSNNVYQCISWPAILIS